MKIIETVDELIQNDAELIQKLMNDFSEVLIFTKPKSKIPYIAYIIDVAVKHIKLNHNDVLQDFKAWSLIILKDMFIDDELINVEDINKIINEFFIFIKTDYDKFQENIIALDDFKKELGFVRKYTLNKNNEKI